MRAHIEGSVHITGMETQKFWSSGLFKFFGPAFMVSIGYMDPGNWATNIEGGSRFGYKLVWVLLASNLMAIVLQTLAARLGQVTECHLAQMCGQQYSRPVVYPLWILAELAIVATDLAEVIGTAVGINLITGLPLLYGVLITATDTMLFLLIQNFGMRKLEAVILFLLSVVASCFILELILTKPPISEVMRGFIPTLDNESVLVAIGIIGATVMPHNFYLHSAVVISRQFNRTDANIRRAVKYNMIDTVVALTIAFFVNLAILMVAASTFYGKEEVTTLQQAHALLETLLDSKIAPFAFGLALICAGQSSTITGTLAGQYVMEGFLDMRIKPWIRRLVTRLIAVIPAVVVIVVMGDSGVYQLLLASQTLLSLQLPFACVPLLKFTGNRRLMGFFPTPPVLLWLGWCSALLIIALNVMFVVDLIQDLFKLAVFLAILAIMLFVALMLFLLWLTFQRQTIPFRRLHSEGSVAPGPFAN